MNLFGWLASPWQRLDLESYTRDLEQAQGCMKHGDFRGAETLLRSLLARLPEQSAPDSRSLRAAVLACLGEVLFHLAKPAEAASVSQAALALADTALAREVLGNLLEIYRWQGRGDLAAECADRLAEDDLARQEAATPGTSGLAPRASQYSRLASLLRAGEPLLRVVADVDGQRFEIDEVLAGKTGAVRFVYARNRLTLRPCEQLTGEGVGLLHQGQFDSALAVLKKADLADPYSPEPAYQAGYACAYLGKYAAAAVHFRKAEECAPGWFSVRSALALLDRVAAGRLPAEVFRTWHALSEAPLPAEGKLRMVEKALLLAPELPHLHLLRGKILRGRNLGFAAETALRRGLELARDPEVVARLCVELAGVVEQDSEKTALLRRAIDLDGDLVATATARVVLHFGS